VESRNGSLSGGGLGVADAGERKRWAPPQAATRSRKPTARTGGRTIF